MRVPEPEDEQLLAWSAILESTQVKSSDGVVVGTVYEVLGAEDIFHGLVLHTAGPDDMTFVPADQVGEITNRKIMLRLTSEEVRALPVYEPEKSFSLGVVGIFRKHVGWIEKRDEHG